MTIVDEIGLLIDSAKTETDTTAEKFVDAIDNVSSCIDRLRDAIANTNFDDFAVRPPNFTLRWKRTSEGEEPPMDTPLQVPDEDSCIERLKRAIADTPNSKDLRPPCYKSRWKRTKEEKPPFGEPLHVPDRTYDFAIYDRGVWLGFPTELLRNWSPEAEMTLISEPPFWQLWVEDRPDEEIL
ncbi:MAG: hypothetical protein HN975_02115 [Anaerolineae bacterium]|jgi:hypothetical protein|nr:hypothetical protein [Anaerolineae bacterium]